MYIAQSTFTAVVYPHLDTIAPQGERGEKGATGTAGSAGKKGDKGP